VRAAMTSSPRKIRHPRPSGRYVYRMTYGGGRRRTRASPAGAAGMLGGMSDDGMPRDSRGLRPCGWCGGRIDQPKIGRLRDYCSQSCRQRAYEDRREAGRIAVAVEIARAEMAQAVDTAPVSSRDEPGGSASPPPRPRRQLGQGPGVAEPLPLWEDDGGPG
jgi:hypothetical protein